MGKTFESLITLTQVSDGAPGGAGAQLRIEFSHEEVLRYVDGLNEITYSPTELIIAVYELDNPAEVMIVTSTDSGEIQEIKINNYNVVAKFNSQTIDFKHFGSSSDNKALYFFVDDYLNINPVNFSDNSNVLSFQLFEGNKLKAEKKIIFRNAMTNELAYFRVHASGITSAIQLTKLHFGEEGLTVTNGGLKIKNLDGETVFSGDDNGNLSITGTITATKGQIGGITIAENGGLYTEGYQITPDRIIAKNISLKEEAEIANYIKLGNSYLYNPDAIDEETGELIRGRNDPLERVVLQSGNILLKDNGYMTLGKITIFGGEQEGQSHQESYISSENNTWKIYESGLAEFNNIYADNCHMGNSVLKVDTIQTGSNLTIYADSWVVDEIGNNYFTLENIENANFYPGTVLLINGTQYVVQIPPIDDTSEGKNIYVENASDITKGSIVTKLGANGQMIFSVCGQSEIKNVNQDFAKSSCLTLSKILVEEFTESENVNYQINFEPQLVLGNLGSLGDQSIKGMGLYAENVYLKGSLTTTTKDNSYAGVNTVNGVTAEKFKDILIGGVSINDNSPIIFWAGAEKEENETLEEAIRKAPFQVTKNGSLYASQGVFEGSIISRSRIQGADIFAARIHGWENDAAAALSIYDVQHGIAFKTESEQTLFTISQDGMVAGETKFIEINGNNAIGYFGDNEYQTVVDMEGISYRHLLKGESSEQIWNQGARLSFLEIIEEETGVFNKIPVFNFDINGQNIARFDQELINLNTATVQAKQNVQFGENVMLSYKQVNGGYDLYVYTSNNEGGNE